MIDNPHKWISDFKEFIEKPYEFEYGMLCIISDNATSKAKTAYKKYISLVSKAVQSWDAIIIENWEIKGFSNVEDKVYKSQIEIAKTLIDKNILSKKIKH